MLLEDGEKEGEKIDERFDRMALDEKDLSENHSVSPSPSPTMATKANPEEPIEVLFVLQDKFDLMDFAGPLEVLTNALHDKSDASQLPFVLFPFHKSSRH